jgi:hypothetical protein
MPMNTTYLNTTATAGGGLISHIALFNGASEITGGSPAYARKAVTWTSPTDGLIRPTANLVFDIPAGATVTEWRGFSASTGGTGYGGQLLTSTPFASQGTYTLQAASTGIDHDAG